MDYALFSLKKEVLPWLGGSVGWSIILYTKMS